MANRTEVTVVNGHRYAVHVAGRRFRPGKPRTLQLADRQLEAVRGNPWLWIEGEDFQEGDELPEPTEDYSELSVATLRKMLKEAGLPVSGNKDALVARLEESENTPVEIEDSSEEE